MTHNDVLRGLRFLLNISDSVLAEIAGLADYPLSRGDIVSFLKREDEAGYIQCNDTVMSHFLNGLVIYKRGRVETRPLPELTMPVNNNVILKKLRVAFELRDTDILSLLEKSGLQITKTELSAFFRNEGHRNYRVCGDQVLRALLKGMND